MGVIVPHTHRGDHNITRGKSQDSPKHKRGGHYERSNTAMGVFGPEVPKIAVGLTSAQDRKRNNLLRFKSNLENSERLLKQQMDSAILESFFIKEQ